MNTKVKILLIRFSSIGDIVLTSPVIRCLKQQLEGEVCLHYLTKSAYAEILAPNPHLDKVFTIEKSVGEVLGELRKEDYHFIVDLHNNFRSWQVKTWLTAMSFTVRKLNVQKWLMVNFKWNFLPEKHLVDRYLETAVSLGIRNDGKGMDYYIPPEKEVQISTLPENFRNGYIAFAIGARHATKRLPAEKIIAICKKSTKSFILLGDEKDAALGETIVSQVCDRVFNACGRYSLTQSASLIAHAEKVIAHDSGLMHIATALNKEVISIWGNTIPEFGMYPYYGKESGQNSHLFQIRGLSCRPCSKIGYDKCPKGHFRCMNDININEIVGLINKPIKAYLCGTKQ